MSLAPAASAFTPATPATGTGTTKATIVVVLLAMTTAALGFFRRSSKGSASQAAKEKKGKERANGHGKATGTAEEDREELRAAQARVAALESQCQAWRERAEEGERERERLTLVVQERDAREEDAAQRLEAAEARLESAVDAAQRREVEQQRAMESLKAEQAALNEQLQDLLATNAQISQDHNDALQLLDAARARLPPDDRLTDHAVLVLVQALNTELAEAAAFFADAFEFEDKAHAPPVDYTTPELADVLERATEILGAEMVAALRSASHHADARRVRHAVQGGLAEYARWMSAAWFFADPDDEQLLADIYQRIRATPALSQAAAGRWRALTHAHVQALVLGPGPGPGPAAEPAPALGAYFVDALVNVLLAAGFRSSPAALHALVGDRPEFGARIARLVSLARGLNRAVGAEVAACELRTLAALPGGPFDGATMVAESEEEAGGEGGDGDGDGDAALVLCTCALGLVRLDKVPGTGTWTRTVLLRSRVLLEPGERTPTTASAVRAA
ncbi:hypothetical protein MIND_01342900 [Mycena indigotica]|uniref:Uncharacterized protein n=1 Tax=Mycena indigotica TaxID=2126181 RepID=A0A8H6VTN9_9AGAR|nr:uncharacterized protein MIND_01342900 [Mycena indigotica]KAF7289698.1 hypothetical protein MIND_01342900 [Mycena indigotica]